MLRASVGNGVAKELIFMTRGHGYEQRRGGSLEGVGGARWEGGKEEKLGQL